MPRPGRNAWTDQDFRRAITQAGRIISCSFGVVGLTSKKDKKTKTVLVFRDDDAGAFAYAFEFKDLEEVTWLCHDLLKMQERIDNGEFDGNGTS